MPKGLGLHNAAKVSEEFDSLQDFSSPDELVDLWALANRQTSFEAVEEYELDWVGTLVALLYGPFEFGSLIIRMATSVEIYLQCCNYLRAHTRLTLDIS